MDIWILQLLEEELLFIILLDSNIGTPLLSAFGSLQNLVMDSSEYELEEVYKVEKDKALQIGALKELNKRLHQPFFLTKKKITSPNIVYDLAFMDVAYEPQKSFGILLLDSRNQVIHKEIISVDTIGFALLDSRLVYNPAIRKSSSRVILFTNGSGGTCTPDQDDIKLSKKILEAGSILGIPLTDFILITPGYYYSFKEHGLL